MTGPKLPTDLVIFTMNHFRDKLSILLLTTMMASYAACASAQEGPKVQAEAKSASGIEELIADLSGGFQARLKARTELEKSGDAAIEPLRKALPNASLQARQEIERLLKILEEDSIVSRAKKLEDSGALADAEGLPEWKRFGELVGEDEAALRFYARLLKAEPQLFGEARKGRSAARVLSRLLEQRASNLVRKTEPRRDFDVNSYAALLLLCSNGEHRLPGASSYNVSAMLLTPTFTRALKSEEGSYLKTLAGQYILRSRIGLQKPLEFAYLYPLPEGLQLARLTLQNRFRGHDGVHAMRVLRKHGTAKDIALLERLFTNRDLVFDPNSGTFTVTNGDVALASAIVMREKDPRDFGFAPKDDRSRTFRFVAASTGFATQAARDAAQAKYFAEFPSAAE